MNSPYRFGILSRDVSRWAQQTNAELLGDRTLGIEVTSSDLARGCGLGNIDPQHVEGGGSSAIERVFGMHDEDLPPEGSTLVTIRPDRDAFGAMAVLLLRKTGRGDLIDKMLISAIGAFDRERGELVKQCHPELVRTQKELQAMQTIVLMDLPLELKVEMIGSILCCEMSSMQIAELSRERVVSETHFVPEYHGRILYVTAHSDLRRARDWANRLADLAVIYDENFEGKGVPRFSLVRREKHFDRWGFERAINELEATGRKMSIEELERSGLTWGGNRNIVSSPSGVGRGTVLTKDVVIATAMKHLEFGIVS